MISCTALLIDFVELVWMPHAPRVALNTSHGKLNVSADGGVPSDACSKAPPQFFTCELQHPFAVLLHIKYVHTQRRCGILMRNLST